MARRAIGFHFKSGSLVLILVPTGERVDQMTCKFCVPFGSRLGLTGISLVPIGRCQRSRRNDNRHLLGTAEISDLSA